MDLRSYTKQELALLYFPDSDPDVARAHLMRWIVRCTQLYEQLQKSGYNKSCKEFNPLQVSYIFFHLGEPWYLSVKIGEYRWASVSWENEMLYLCIVIQKEKSHTDLTDLTDLLFVARNGSLTKPHSKNSVRSLKSVRSVWENETLREESKIRSIREIRVQESGTAQRPLNI